MWCLRVRQSEKLFLLKAPPGPTLTIFPMNLHCVYVISSVSVDHINYTVCQCSWPHVLISSRWITVVSPRPVSLLSFVAHKSWAEWTSPSTPEYIESHFKRRFCEAFPCGWIAFMAFWIDKLCFPERIQRTPWLFCWPYHSVRCYHFSSASWIHSQLEMIRKDDNFFTFY